MMLFWVFGCDNSLPVEQPNILVVTRIEEEEATTCLEQAQDYTLCKATEFISLITDVATDKDEDGSTPKLSVLLLLSDTINVSGSLTLNGSHMGQGVTNIYGVDAWLQQSDWNQLYVPIPSRKTFDGSVQVEMYIPSGSRASICPFGTKVDYNTLTQALCVTVTDTEIVLSNPQQHKQTLVLPSYMFDRWNTWTISFERAGSVTVQVRERLWYISIDLTGASTEYVVLTSGHSPAWTSSKVAFANLQVKALQ